MKRKGASRSTIAKYLTVFIELHDEIVKNPKTKNVSEIVRKHRCGNHPITMLKKTGVINQTKNGLFWNGEKPSVNMVLQITEMIHQYKMELAHRKKSEGDLFRKRKQALKPFTKDRMLADDEHVITIASGDVHIKKINEKLLCEEIANKPLKDINQDDLNRWHELYSKQIGEPSGIPIKQPLPDSSLISEYVDHHEGSLNTTPFKKVENEQQLNWFQKLIKSIFKIK